MSTAPINILRARAEARALLFAAGDFDLGTAFQPLEAYAVESGLIDRYGRAAVDTIIMEAFKTHMPVQ